MTTHKELWPARGVPVLLLTGAEAGTPAGKIPAEVTITTKGDRRTVIQRLPDRTIKEIFDHTTDELIQRWVWPKKE